MQILFIGDIFGSPGRKIVRDHLGHVVETNKVDLVIASAENSSGGFGLTPAIADELFDMGCHVLTTGNHIWDKREIVDYFNSANGDASGRARKACPAWACMKAAQPRDRDLPSSTCKAASLCKTPTTPSARLTPYWRKSPAKW